jgi:S-adenosylmethionine decarboxylase
MQVAIRQSVGVSQGSDSLGASEKPECHFGEHLMIDAYQGSYEKLLDRDEIYRCLKDLPTLLGMHILAEPEVHWASPNGIKDPGGWSGIVVIVESHLSIHTFPSRRFASIDVYTCRNGLDTEQVKGYFREVFGFEEMETNFVVRGKRYPLVDF